MLENLVASGDVMSVLYDPISEVIPSHKCRMNIITVTDIQRCIQKFLDWPPGSRTANSTALCQ
jgi:hypothetical protein